MDDGALLVHFAFSGDAELSLESRVREYSSYVMPRQLRYGSYFQLEITGSTPTRFPDHWCDALAASTTSPFEDNEVRV